MDSRAYVKRAKGETTKRYVIKIKPRSPTLLYKPQYHRELNINGVVLKVVTRRHLSKLLGVTYETINKWHKQGVFSDPIFIEKDSKGRATQYWLIKQMSCFLYVLNSILREGYLYIQWSNFPEQVESIHKGMNHYADRAIKRLDNNELMADTTDKFGVEFIEDGT